MGTISIRFQSSDVRTAAQRDRRVREAGRGMRSLWARHVEVKPSPVTDPKGDQ